LCNTSQRQCLNHVTKILSINREPELAQNKKDASERPSECACGWVKLMSEERVGKVAKNNAHTNERVIFKGTSDTKHQERKL
jgi:hypothetical protein